MTRTRAMSLAMLVALAAPAGVLSPAAAASAADAPADDAVTIIIPITQDAVTVTVSRTPSPRTSTTPLITPAPGAPLPDNHTPAASPATNTAAVPAPAPPPLLPAQSDPVTITPEPQPNTATALPSTPAPTRPTSHSTPSPVAPPSNTAAPSSSSAESSAAPQEPPVPPNGPPAAPVPPSDTDEAAVPTVAAVPPSTAPNTQDAPAAQRQAPQPAAPQASTQSQLASGMPFPSGVFGHSQDRAAQYEQVTGRKVDVIGVFPARGSWDTIMDTWWLDTAPEGFTGTLDVGVPLWQADGDLTTAATGGYNAQWEQLGKTIHDRYPGSAVRIGWEFNLEGWDHHATPENVEQWKQAFRHASMALKHGGPSLLVTWNPNKGKGDSLPDAGAAYPGDDVVDLVGLDAYDWWPAYDESTWPEHRDSDQGWQHWVDFARAHGKKFTVPEWGVAPGNDHGGGDNPYYIKAVMDFLATNRDIVHSQIYFDETEPYIANSIAAGQVPQAADAMKNAMTKLASSTPQEPSPSPTGQSSIGTAAPPAAPSSPTPSEPTAPAAAAHEDEHDAAQTDVDHGPVPGDTT